jgi:predicted MFS family arabinose efflux permease
LPKFKLRHRRRERTAVLHEPQFRTLLSTHGLTFLGNSLAPVALPFAVLSIRGTVADIGAVLAVGTASSILILLVAGVVADNMPRRLLLSVSALVQGLAMLVMAALLLTGRCEIWHLLALQALFGAASALGFPAFTAVVPQIVEARHLRAANGLITVTESGAQVVGPGIAGVLIALGSPALAFAVDAVSFFASALVLVWLHPPVAEKTGERMHFVRDLIEGWKEMTCRRWYWITLLAHSACNSSIAVFFVIGPVIAEKKLGGASTWGAVCAAGAIGGVLGGLTFMRLRLRRPLVTGNLAILLFVPCLLLLVAPAQTPALVLAAAAGMFGVSILNGAWNSTIQQLIPNAVLSRLSSFDWLISFTTMPLSFALAGELAKSLGTSVLLCGASAGLCVPCALTLLAPSIRAVRSDRDGTVVVAGSRVPALSEELM